MIGFHRIDKDSKEARNKRIFENVARLLTQEDIAEQVGIAQSQGNDGDVPTGYSFPGASVLTLSYQAGLSVPAAA